MEASHLLLRELHIGVIEATPVDDLGAFIRFRIAEAHYWFLVLAARGGGLRAAVFGRERPSPPPGNLPCTL